MPPRRYFVAGWITFSLKPASATETLTVEHGWKPVLSASFWFTMLRMRPVAGIDHDHDAVVLAERVHRGAADVQIFAIDVVAVRGIGISRARPGTAGDHYGRRAARARSGDGSFWTGAARSRPECAAAACAPELSRRALPGRLVAAACDGGVRLRRRLAGAVAANAER